MALWRLTLDPDYSFATELGCQRDVHCGDFSPQKGSFTDTFRCPVTGVVMLRPSWQQRDIANDFKALTSWRMTTDHWKQVKRSRDLVEFYTRVFPAGVEASLIEIDVDVAIVAIGAAVEKFDNLLWVHESKFQLDVDQPFGVEFQGLTDEVTRKNNWFCLQWDDIQIHFSYQGRARVYKHNRENLQEEPTLHHEFEFAHPSELLNRHLYFRFVPIAGVGLVVYFSTSAPRSSLAGKNVGVGTARGYLIPWEATGDTDGRDRLFESSPVRVGLNPYFPIVMGFQVASFPSTGTYTDAAHDPLYEPTVVPSAQASVYNTRQQTVTARERNLDDTADWGLGDQAGRVQLTLSTTDTRYTPFVAGYGVYWPPVFNTRSATPLTLPVSAQGGDVLLYIEVTQDEYGRLEGKAKMKLSSATGKQIAKRGDATWELEYSTNDGADWNVFDGGLAKDWHYTVKIDGGGDGSTWFLATCSLRDMFERFRECHKALEVSSDDLSIGESFNKILEGTGFAPIASLPAFTTQIKFPKVTGNQWRFAPREGDEVDQIVSLHLLFLRQQKSEWRARFDWEAGEWLLERKPRDAVDFWSLKRRRSQENQATRTWSYGDDPEFHPEPPEFNILVPEGLSSSDSTASRIHARPIPDPGASNPSLTDPNSLDFLGRAKVAVAKFWPVSDKELLGKLGRTLYDAAGHHRLKADPIHIPKLQLSLEPCTAVKVYDSTDTVLLDGWIKRRTIVIDQNDKETMTLALDTEWLGEIE